MKEIIIKILEAILSLFKKTAKPIQDVVKPKENVAVIETPLNKLHRAIIACCDEYNKKTETAGKNRASWIDPMVKYFHGNLGDPYCAYGILFVLFVKVKEYYLVHYNEHIDFNLPMTGSTQKLWNDSSKRYHTDKAKPGSIAIWKKKGTYRGHAAFCLSYSDQGIFKTFEFNTSSKNSLEVVRDGEGAYYKTRDMDGYSDMQLLGFIDLEACMIRLDKMNV